MASRASRAKPRSCKASAACSKASAVSTPTTMIRYTFRNSRKPCQGLGLWISMPPPSGSSSRQLSGLAEPPQPIESSAPGMGWKRGPTVSAEAGREADVVALQAPQHHFDAAGLDHPLQAVIAVLALEQALLHQ